LARKILQGTSRPRTASAGLYRSPFYPKRHETGLDLFFLQSSSERCLSLERQFDPTIPRAGTGGGPQRWADVLREQVRRPSGREMTPRRFPIFIESGFFSSTGSACESCEKWRKVVCGRASYPTHRGQLVQLNGAQLSTRALFESSLIVFGIPPTLKLRHTRYRSLILMV